MLCRVLWWSLRLADVPLRSLVVADVSTVRGQVYDWGMWLRVQRWREMYLGWRGRCKEDHRDGRFVIDW